MTSPDPYADWRRAFLEAHDAGVTMLMRALSIQRAFLRGDLTGGPEAQSMVTEKIIAAQQGLGEAALASLKSLAEPPETPAAATAVAKKIARAAMKPAKKKVRDNAARLTRAKKKRAPAKPAKKTRRRK
jgi:hypothetical protein